ncbi:MAG: type IV secretion protein Rhs [Pseudomonadota bacterium]|nr:type IV secretion protein Rhs [Pseudomonadota bacterium]
MSIRRFLLQIEYERPLTHGEIELARSIFADQLDWLPIRIVSSRWILRGYALSPNGHVYFHPDDWCDDFSVADLADQGWFIHELVHVWQVQHGLRVVRRALLDRRYRYQLRPDKPFLAYGVEQQAQMVQDYFMRRAHGQDCAAWVKCLPFDLS